MKYEMDTKRMRVSTSWSKRHWTVLMGLSLIVCLSFSEAQAQPKKSRVQQTQQAQQKKQGTQSAQGMTRRMQISYPVALDVPEDVVWRRDIYRELDLTKEANAGLYYPVIPQGKQLNLFTYIFKLAQNGYIPIYAYSVENDGNDDFSDASKVQLKTVLDDHRIYYEEQDGKIRVSNNHIPSEEVTKFYLKESAYYDQGNSSFHIKVLALCPIMVDKDFGPEPLFWVKYSDLEPFLSRQTVMVSDVNNAATMSMDDFFTTNKYKGDIYKTTNMLGKTLTQIVGDDPDKLSEEQKRIEAELEQFRKGIFGDPAKRDSLDSIANNHPQNVKAKEKKTKKTRTTSRRTKVGKSSSSSSSSASTANGAARVSVRRQRH